MSPTRLLILGILFYILYRLLFAGQKSKGNSGQDNSAGANAPAAQDVLVEDPVCHTYIPQMQAVVLKEKGQNIYFCSDKCRAKFISAKGD